MNSDLATLSDTDATTPSDTITLNAVDSFGVAAAPQSIAVTVTPGQTFTLTTGKDTVAGGPANNMIIAKTATLTAGDNINGGTGDEHACAARRRHLQPGDAGDAYERRGHHSAGRFRARPRRR